MRQGPTYLSGIPENKGLTGWGGPASWECCSMNEGLDAELLRIVDVRQSLQLLWRRSAGVFAWSCTKATPLSK